MTNLMWPGDYRAHTLMSDQALWEAMLRTESAWLSAMVEVRLIGHHSANCDLASLVTDEDRERVAIAAEDGGNPVIALVSLLRSRAPEPVAPWIHRGLTSQDVVDTALMLTLGEVVEKLVDALGRHVSVLCELAERHRHTPMVARTLTQHAVPTTMGAKAAAWLGGICDAYQRLTDVETPVQIGGAAATLAASTELARLQQLPDPAGVSVRLIEASAETLGLTPRMPWHTQREPITTIADALVGCTDAWGRIAADVVTLSRPEIGELSEPTAEGRGASSTMPDKRNPVLSVLIRRAALTTPPLAATLHTAAALANDERPDGVWHAEWDTLRILARRTVVAGSQCTDLLAGLHIDTDRMAANFHTAHVSGEQHAIAELVGKPPSTSYLGATDIIIDATLDRARRQIREIL